MGTVATAAGRGKGLNGAGAHIPQPIEHQALNKGAFDLDDGSFITRPRTLIAILVSIFIVGGMVAVAHYRLGNIEAAVAAIPAAIEDRIDQAEQANEQSRKIACLQQQIANKAWVCPDAIQVAKQPEQPRKAARQVVKTETDPGFFGAWASTKGK